MSITETSSSRPVERKGLIMWLVEALYIARQREARRVIRRYQHLIGDDFRDHPKIVTSVPAQARECEANGDRAKMLLRAIHRALEDA